MAAMQQQTLTVRVARRRQAAARVCAFELAAVDGGALPPFRAGDHVDVYVPDGPVRPYSLCNDPAERWRYVIGVLREADSRGGSAGLHARVHEGDLLRIGLPRSQFALWPAAHTLLLAGGIGITPLLGMARQLAREGGDFVLHYCARSRAQAAFLDELQASGFADRVVLHFDDEPSQRLPLGPLLAGRHPDARLYVCGPPRFMDWILTSAAACGWPAERLHAERFSGASQTVEGDQPFEVVLAYSGGCHVVPAGKSVAAVLVQAGIELALSCESGLCGTCVLPVLDGMPEHRDSYLTEEERARNDCFTPCCSRARSARLVIGL